jgi:hypothetical protein
LLADAAVLASEVQQRVTFTSVRTDHLRDEDGVIPGFHGLNDRALHRRETPGDQRSTRLAFRPLESFEAIRDALRETNRQLLLVFRKHVDGIPCACAEVGQDGAPVIDADQNQRRGSRYGGKRINRKAIWSAVRCAHRCNSDARCKAGAGFAENVAIEDCSYSHTGNRCGLERREPDGMPPSTLTIG